MEYEREREKELNKNKVKKIGRLRWLDRKTLDA